MSRSEEMGEIRERLIKKRDEVFELKEIQAVNRALTRIELGEYGACEACENGIEVERLEAIPWTSVCSKHARTE
jgi:RNA polymerase-binding transcription factor DksA